MTRNELQAIGLLGRPPWEVRGTIFCIISDPLAGEDATTACSSWEAASGLPQQQAMHSNGLLAGVLKKHIGKEVRAYFSPWFAHVVSCISISELRICTYVIQHIVWGWGCFFQGLM